MLLPNASAGLSGLLASCAKTAHKDHLPDACTVGKLVRVTMDSGGPILRLFLEVACPSLRATASTQLQAGEAS